MVVNIMTYSRKNFIPHFTQVGGKTLKTQKHAFAYFYQGVFMANFKSIGEDICFPQSAFEKEYLFIRHKYRRFFHVSARHGF